MVFAIAAHQIVLKHTHSLPFQFQCAVFSNLKNLRIFLRRVGAGGFGAIKEHFEILQNFFQFSFNQKNQSFLKNLGAEGFDAIKEPIR